jgi:HlyD family secretion protein
MSSGGDVAVTSETKSTVIWTKNGPVLNKVEVRLGSDDGINYELVSGLKEGEEIVLSMVAEKAPTETKQAVKSPFMPTRPGQKK